MKSIAPLLVVCGALLGLLQPEHAAASTMRLASLEWLPYAGASLPDGGVSEVVARAVAAQFSYDVKIDYFPWKRAMEVGGNDPDFDGYFPAYYTDERARHCYFSAPMGHSTIGLVTLAAAPLRWHVLDDSYPRKHNAVYS